MKLEEMKPGYYLVKQVDKLRDEIKLVKLTDEFVEVDYNKVIIKKYYELYEGFYYTHTDSWLSCSEVNDYCKDVGGCCVWDDYNLYKYYTIEYPKELCKKILVERNELSWTKVENIKFSFCTELEFENCIFEDGEDELIKARKAYLDQKREEMFPEFKRVVDNLKEQHVTRLKKENKKGFWKSLREWVEDH